MNTQLGSLLKDKEVKPSEKTETISRWILDGALPLDQLVAFAATAKDPARATCIEAIEYATKQQPAVMTGEAFDFVTQSLGHKAPRVKWESAKVIGNTAALFGSKLTKATSALLANATHTGTVVRWSMAFALGEILKLHAEGHEQLLAQLKTLAEQEEKNSIKSIYLAAIKRS